MSESVSEDLFRCLWRFPVAVMGDVDEEDCCRADACSLLEITEDAFWESNVSISEVNRIYIYVEVVRLKYEQLLTLIVKA